MCDGKNWRDKHYMYLVLGGGGTKQGVVLTAVDP